MSGKTIWLTAREYEMISQSKDLFTFVTGVKMSWGAYLLALSFGAVAAKSLEGFLTRCPDCGSQVEMILVKPHLKVK